MNKAVILAASVPTAAACSNEGAAPPTAPDEPEAAAGTVAPAADATPITSNPLRNIKARANGAGPVFSFVRAGEGVTVITSLKWLKEFNNRYRLEGGITWLKLVGSFWIRFPYTSTAVIGRRP